MLTGTGSGLVIGFLLLIQTIRMRTNIMPMATMDILTKRIVFTETTVSENATRFRRSDTDQIMYELS